MNSLIKFGVWTFFSGVAPFPGATTGTGGRIRDVQATGRGAHVVAGTAGYSFGNLNIPGEAIDLNAHMLYIRPSDAHITEFISILNLKTFVNSLAPSRCGMQFWMLNILCATAIRWMPQDLSSDRSTLVQVVAWCQ